MHTLTTEYISPYLKYYQTCTLFSCAPFMFISTSRKVTLAWTGILVYLHLLDKQGKLNKVLQSLLSLPSYVYSELCMNSFKIRCTILSDLYLFENTMSRTWNIQNRPISLVKVNKIV